MRFLALLAALLGGLLALSLTQGIAVPWQPACTVVDPRGAVLAQGAPAEMATLVASPSGDLARALRRGPAVSCRVANPSSEGVVKEGPLGLTPRAQQVRTEVRRAFGEVPDGGFGPESPLPGRSARGAHSSGRAIDFFFRPYQDRGQARQGWRLANWAVANADRLGVSVVIYRDRIWTARRSAQGWRDYRFRGPDPDNPVNRHLDHVHLEVA